MDQPSPPRRSLWRFSLRELLLLMLAIAAFLGWGRAIYQQRPRPYVPTDFVDKLDLSSDLMAIREELKDNDFTWGTSSGGRTTQGERTEREFRYAFPLRPANHAPFMDALEQRLQAKVSASGCTRHGIGRSRSSEFREFRLRYRQAKIHGSLRAILIGDEKVHLLILVEEQRQSP